MDWIIIIIAIFLSVLGIIGAIVPILPGPILSFSSLLFLQASQNFGFSQKFLITMGVIALIVSLMDYVIPGIGTKKFGGTKFGVRGSNIGLLVAVFLFPFLGIVIGPFGLVGIIIGPFAGAYFGEILGGEHKDRALKSAIGSFIGFIAGTLSKLVYAIIASVFFIMAFF